MLEGKKRLVWIDAVKGIGILLVMLSHSCGIPVIGNWLYANYMPLFFILSGYTLKSVECSLEFVKRKAVRLLIPYIFYGLLTSSLGVVFTIINNNFEILEAILKYTGLIYSRFCFFPLGTEPNIYFFRAENSPLWFLTAMFMAYIWVMIYDKVKRKYKLLIAILYIILTLVMSNLPILLPWSLDTSFIGALFIIVGKELKKYKLEKYSTNKKLASFIVGCGLYIILVYINGYTNFSIRIYGDWNELSIFLFGVNGIIGTILYCMVIKYYNQRLFVSLLASIGRMSMTLMCIHLLLFRVIHIFIKEANLNQYVDGIICLSVTILCAYVFKKISSILSKYIYWLIWL